MCVSKSFIWVERGNGYEALPRSCGKCWRCKANRVSDFVGRALCEAFKSDWAMTLTLTYAPRDDGWDKSVNKEHFQKFARALRKRGHKIRYLVAGEYGSLDGRAHFHVILFGLGKKPRCWLQHKRIGAPDNQIPHRRRAWWPEWPHGHVFADLRATEKSMRYAAKYCLKEGKEAWFSVSKKPALGFRFFEEKARQDAALGIWPSSFDYLPPNGHRKKRYLLTGAARRDYLFLLTMFAGKRWYLDWKETLGQGRNIWVQKALKKGVRQHAKQDADALLKEEAQLGRSKFEVSLRPEKRHCFFYDIRVPYQANASVTDWWPRMRVEEWQSAGLVGELNGKRVVYNAREPDILLHPPNGRWSHKELILLNDLWDVLCPVRRSQTKKSGKLRHLFLPLQLHKSLKVEILTHSADQIIEEAMCLIREKTFWGPSNRWTTANETANRDQSGHDLAHLRKGITYRGAKNETNDDHNRALADFW